MIYITSHTFSFGIETENGHGGEWTEAAAAQVKATLDAMSADRVTALHANLQAIAAGIDDELCDDYNDACNAGCLVNAYPDFVVTMSSA